MPLKWGKDYHFIVSQPSASERDHCCCILYFENIKFQFNKNHWCDISSVYIPHNPHHILTLSELLKTRTDKTILMLWLSDWCIAIHDKGGWWMLVFCFCWYCDTWQFFMLFISNWVKIRWYWFKCWWWSFIYCVSLR